MTNFTSNDDFFSSYLMDDEGVGTPCGKRLWIVSIYPREIVVGYMFL